jgi:hypothetical protein
MPATLGAVAVPALQVMTCSPVMYLAGNAFAPVMFSFPAEVYGGGPTIEPILSRRPGARCCIRVPGFS